MQNKTRTWRQNPTTFCVSQTSEGPYLAQQWFASCEVPDLWTAWSSAITYHKTTQEQMVKEREINGNGRRDEIIKERQETQTNKHVMKTQHKQLRARNKTHETINETHETINKKQETRHNTQETRRSMQEANNKGCIKFVDNK